MPKRESSEINASSMADIAFLLLIFFLVTTTIGADKGLPILLPPEKTDQSEVDVNDRNVLTILINSQDQLLVEEQDFKIKDIKSTVEVFIKAQEPAIEGETVADSPSDAVVSLKADRGTSYDTYLAVLDQVKAGYHQVRADYINISVKEYLDWQSTKEVDLETYQKKKLERAKDAFPLQISEAEPTEIGR